MNREAILHAVFPFAYEEVGYWYYSAYFCLFFFMPALNKMMKEMSLTEGKRVLLAAFIVLSVLQTVFKSQFAYTMNGYSFLWLAVMYLAGAFIRKYDIGKRDDRGRYLAGYLLSALFTWILKMAVEHVGYIVTGEYTESVWMVNYTFPLTIVCAVCLFLAFKDLQFETVIQTIIGFFAPAAFDVYLFHDESLLRNVAIKGRFIRWLTWHPLLMILAVIGTALIIWFVGSLFGRVRMEIFKVLRCEKACEMIERKVEKAMGKVL